MTDARAMNRARRLGLRAEHLHRAFTSVAHHYDVSKITPGRIDPVNVRTFTVKDADDHFKVTIERLET